MSETGKISDGYHTFDELYAHRGALFIALCSSLDRVSTLEDTPPRCWKSKLHSDGTKFDGWFIAGIDRFPGQQITYHFPLADWDALLVPERDKAPEWDGHSPSDVIERLKLLL